MKEGSDKVALIMNIQKNRFMQRLPNQHKIEVTLRNDRFETVESYLEQRITLDTNIQDAYLQRRIILARAAAFTACIHFDLRRPTRRFLSHGNICQFFEFNSASMSCPSQFPVHCDVIYIFQFSLSPTLY